MSKMSIFLVLADRPLIVVVTRGTIMLKRLTVLLLVFFVAASPLPVAGKDMSAGSRSDQFDADFADDFADDFSSEGDFDEVLIDDPFERVNRAVFWVNDKLYFFLMKPVAKGYRLILPRQARVSVGNAFTNATAPVRAANDLLQFKFHDVATELYRLLVNSTVGLAGLFDPAASLAGVEKLGPEDFGQTLGYYGAGHGFYLVLPVIGPSSLRDGAGSLADTFVDPLSYVDLTTLEFVGVKTYRAINSLSLDRDTYEGIVRDSLDPYLFVRAAYAQRRAAQVGKVDYDILSFDGTFLDDDTFKPFKWMGL